MTIEKTAENGVLTLAPAGRLDTVASPALEEEINNILPDTEMLVFDLAGLDYISSAGLRVLLVAHKKMMQRGGMKVINVNEMIADIFDVTGFSTILTIE